MRGRRSRCHSPQTNCYDFLETLGNAAAERPDLEDEHFLKLCVDVARLAESEGFAVRRRERRDVFESPPPWMAAIWALMRMTHRRDDAFVGLLAKQIAQDEQALSTAANIALANHDKSDAKDRLHVQEADLDNCRVQFAENVAQAVDADRFFKMSSPGYVLLCFSSIAPASCPAIFSAIKKKDPTLDTFALELLAHAFDSVKGQTYSLVEPIERLTAFVDLEEPERHAKQRLADTTLGYPARAAWRSVIEKQSLYGVDGSASSRQ